MMIQCWVIQLLVYELAYLLFPRRQTFRAWRNLTGDHNQNQFMYPTVVQMFGINCPRHYKLFIFYS